MEGAAPARPAPAEVTAAIEATLAAGASAVPAPKIPAPTIDREGLKEDMDRTEAEVDAFMDRLRRKTEVTLSPTIRPRLAEPRTGPGSVGASMPEVTGE